MRQIPQPTARGLNFLLSMALLCVGGHAQVALNNDPPFYGPFNGVFLPDGDGLEDKLNEHDSILQAEIPLVPVRLDSPG